MVFVALAPLFLLFTAHSPAVPVTRPGLAFVSPGNVKGLVAAVYSPFHPNGTLNADPAGVAAQARYLNETGVGTAFVCGTTGESVDLTVDERMRLVELWVKPCKKYALRLMVHVGADSVMDARRLAQHAEEVGAWGIAAMPPTYIKPGTVEMLVETMSFVAGGAPSLPFYYYHIPGMSGVTFKMKDFLATAVATDATGNPKLRNLNGIKFTDTDLSDLLACVRFPFRGRVPNMLYGLDAQLLSALVLGVHGAVGSSYNFNGVMEGRVLDAVEKGDIKEAANAQAAVVSFMDAVYGAVPGVNNGKALINLLGKGRGLDVGPPRLPQRAATADESAELKSVAKKWCSTMSKTYVAPWCEDL